MPLREREFGICLAIQEDRTPGLSKPFMFGARVVAAHTEDSFREALRSGLQGNEPLVIEAVVNPSPGKGGSA
jgi:hypothetical protein